jgi:hypothetical protein
MRVYLKDEKREQMGRKRENPIGKVGGTRAICGNFRKPDTQGEWEFTGRQDKVLGGVLAGTNYAMVPFWEPLALFRGPSLKVDNL